ncbi:endonuclease/exonuclease/phosphatase family protein [Alkaliphilus hydrothermalis]|uniref:Endonuclease/exonuclease/phosphatase family metal-dependent hydrolase n=1 Tax=Alkaliphilus hydrothermalis TaxID=1482730 RepID=A0ABS2NNY0_9FIRM|nr:endonuclease/exonuclease/phosphatase family protein [Alkaliphilus hydrothermalis]MBM7614653.1 endonuclease/exonuclease/phosphatase family metal-dependent hydrolase [Alkaliphilus hydrothermalis]
MVKIRKIAVVMIVLIGFGLVTKASSHGGMEVIKYVDSQGVSHIEIQTPKDIDHLILEILDNTNEMTHYFILEHPLIKTNDMGIQLNHFYITKRMANFDKFSKIRIYPQNNSGKIYEMKELESIQMTLDKESSVGEKKLKIMTYNIHHGKSLSRRNTLNKMTEIIKDSGVEIVGLQEVDSGMARSKFINQMKYLGNQLSMNFVFGVNLNIATGKYGNGILSVYPIESSENIALPSGREPRGLLSSVINVDGKKIHFLVTHLGLNQQERSKQIDVILKYIQTLPHDVILVGDFNAGSEYREMRELTKKMVDASEEMDMGDIPTFDLPMLSRRIDFIFVDPNLKVKSYNVIRSRASDHYPIYSEITL